MPSDSQAKPYRNHPLVSFDIHLKAHRHLGMRVFAAPTYRVQYLLTRN